MLSYQIICANNRIDWAIVVDKTLWTSVGPVPYKDGWQPVVRSQKYLCRQHGPQKCFWLFKSTPDPWKTSFTRFYCHQVRQWRLQGGAVACFFRIGSPVCEKSVEVGDPSQGHSTTISLDLIFILVLGSDRRLSGGPNHEPLTASSVRSFVYSAALFSFLDLV